MSCDQAAAIALRQALNEATRRATSRREVCLWAMAVAAVVLVALALTWMATRRPLPYTTPSRLYGLRLAMGDGNGTSTVIVTLLCEEPCIRLVENFISPADADYIVEKYRHTLARSTVAGPTEENETSGARTSSTSFLPDGRDDERIAAIERNAVLLTGIPIKFWETFQLTHYDSGQEYRPHFDWFDESDNNRALTVFAYLNDVASENGGETEFTKLGIKVTPRKGRAVIWKNCSARGNSVVCDPETEHAGTPPLAGEKFGLNCWARTDHYR